MSMLIFGKIRGHIRMAIDKLRLPFKKNTSSIGYPAKEQLMVSWWPAIVVMFPIGFMYSEPIMLIRALCDTVPNGLLAMHS